MLKYHHHHILFAKKRKRATRKAKAHHTLVAHYITIVHVRIKHTTHISTYKHSKQVYYSTHYTLTHTQTQNNHLKCRPRSTLLVTVLLTVYNYKELITLAYCSVILPADCKNIFTLSAKVLIDKNCFNSLGRPNWFHSILALCLILLLPKFLFTEITCK